MYINIGMGLLGVVSNNNNNNMQYIQGGEID
jgi:hypothetical protein